MTASAQLAAKDTSPDPILTAICTGVNNVRVKTSTNLLNITELREMIMDELDPLTMLNLVSTSRAALATFERYPLRYLNAAMEHVSLYFAEAIIEATRRTPSDDILLGPESVLFEDQPHSMTELDNSYAMYDGVETLATSSIWKTCVKDPENGASSSIDDRYVSEIEDIRMALWYFHIHCLLFHQKPTSEHGEVSFPSVYSQRKYLDTLLHVQDYHFMDRFYSVYRDLSCFLAELYEQNWVLSFRDVYRNHVDRSTALSQGESRSEDDWPYEDHSYSGYYPGTTAPFYIADGGFWSDSVLTQQVHEDFFMYVDYHTSLGVPFLARMYRRNLDPSFWNFPAEKSFTTVFFPQAYDKLALNYPIPRGSRCDLEYALLPSENGSKGYRLHLMVPSASDGYLFESDELLFTDGDFKPPHLGNLTWDPKPETVGEPSNAEISNNIQESITSEAPGTSKGSTLCKDQTIWKSLRSGLLTERSEGGAVIG